MRVSKWTIVGLLPLLMAIGCQQARFVQRDANGGIIAVSSDRERMRAMKLIEKEYGKDFVIESEGEVITGQSTVNNTDENRQSELNLANPFRPVERVNSQTTTTTTDVKEWQIRFRRGGAQPTAAPVQQAVAKIPSAVVPASAVQPAQYLAGPKQGVVCTDGCQECKVP